MGMKSTNLELVRMDETQDFTFSAKGKTVNIKLCKNYRSDK